MNPEQALQRLAHAGLVEQDQGAWRTTVRWQRAFMRAEVQIVEFAEANEDPRVPITYALVHALGRDVPDDDMNAMVEAMLPLELREEAELEPDTDEPEAALESELEP